MAGPDSVEVEHRDEVDDERLVATAQIVKALVAPA